MRKSKEQVAIEKRERELIEERVRLRNERDAAKKRRQRQNYIVGEIVIDRLSTIEKLDPERYYHYQDIKSFAPVVKFFDIILNDKDNIALFNKLMSETQMKEQTSTTIESSDE